MKIKLKEYIYSKSIKTKNFLSPLFLSYLRKDSILLYYSDFNNNWGDAVNEFLIEKLTKRKVVSAKRVFNLNNRTQITGIGSILSSDLKGKIIWGSGFIKPPETAVVSPKKILALRGKKSGEIMSLNGIQDPEIYGDPALLFPQIYNPVRKRKFKLGIIPHYTEVKEFENNLELTKRTDITVISPIVKDGNFYEIVDKLLECENIASSSLHGLILADAYGIPSLRITYGNMIIGGDFKYEDYYSGVGINFHEKLKVAELNSLIFDEMIDRASVKPLNIDHKSLQNTLFKHLEESN